ncbi:helix-turn-helix domain-containing protein [uncultured Allofournierella sp.]|uniref:helix-turn-helix domain-containing protein n=1 Tax=uncultured Allofournierella sp. TaxID=1940258 RepID=UPI003753470F
MTTEFNRIITLLRKERGITQKQAAADLGVSQALLSHYEKGIRECGLEFVVRVADYYDVSCDYLLGRSADRNGLTLRVEDIPNPEAAKDSIYKGSTLPTMNKKLISNSLNILFDKLAAGQNSGLVTEVSAYLSIAVYKMFRLLYSSNSKNAASLFSLSNGRWEGYSDAAMNLAQANVSALLEGEEVGDKAGMKDTSCFAMTSQTLEQEYRLYHNSLMMLINNSEKRIQKGK